MPTQQHLHTLYEPIGAHIEAVRAEVAQLWQDVLGLVGPTPGPLPGVGGKLLRPAMCLLSAGAAGAGHLERYVPMATAMEMFHLAALAHDDVIDGADLRRGATSLNARWNNHAAVLGGDYLVARGITILAEYGSCAAITNAIECIRLMAEGELADFGRGESPRGEEECIALARAKTATLFGVACSTPSCLLCGPHRQDFYAFGLAVGTAFQLVDDLLDLTQSETTLGKPACGDLLRGKKTLPLLFLRERLDETDRARLDALEGPSLSEAEREWVLESLERSGATARTQSVAERFAREAREALGNLPPSPYQDSLLGLTDFILARRS